MREPIVAGVDGSAGAWVVAIAGTVASPALHWCADMGAVLGLAGAYDVTVIGVDMPIGLPVAEPRSSDAAARAMLGARRSSLFPTPRRAVLDAVDYPDALERSRAASGRGLSKQAWNLVPSIRQAREAAATVRAVGGPALIEVHPETSFAVMAGAVLAPKRMPAGIAQRVALLARAFPDLDVVSLAADPVALVQRPTAPKASRPRIAGDDVTDALAAAWSALRYAAGTARVLGEGTDPDGFPLTLVV